VLRIVDSHSPMDEQAAGHRVGARYAFLRFASNSLSALLLALEAVFDIVADRARWEDRFSGSSDCFRRFFDLRIGVLATNAR